MHNLIFITNTIKYVMYIVNIYIYIYIYVCVYILLFYLIEGRGGGWGEGIVPISSPVF